MRWVKEIIQKEDGSALATVLNISVIISLFIGTVLSGILLQSRFIQRDIHSFKALYVAEEGVYRFLNEYSITENLQTNQEIILSDGSEVEVTVSLFGGFLDVESTAQVSNQQRTIRILSGKKGSNVVEYALLLSEDANVSEDSEVSENQRQGTRASQREKGQQFEEIEAVQRTKRKQNHKRKIDNIEKSKQNDKKELREAALEALEKLKKNN
ncbi:MAG: hypothetical protein JJ971_13495 [Balneolaceae bacterium]|nr:hypothetical protein [Balneolaceae bacterium]MBO6547130.1 hypothetical protein [Balneolaceae bacterium]MBO6647923.1 hypothetical protein [Balneolaceae bacterium]